MKTLPLTRIKVEVTGSHTSPETPSGEQSHREQKVPKDTWLLPAVCTFIDWSFSANVPQQEQVIGFWSQIIWEKRQDLDTSLLFCAVHEQWKGQSWQRTKDWLITAMQTNLWVQLLPATAPFVAVFLIFNGSCFLPAAFPLITTSLSLRGVHSAFSRTVLAQKVVALFVWKCSPARITK